MVRSRVRLFLGIVEVTISYNYRTTKTMYGSDLASLTDTVASLYTKEKVKNSVRKSIPSKVMLLWQRQFPFSNGNFDAILKMSAHLSASIFTSKSNHCSLIGHRILLYNFNTYCMMYRLSIFEKLMNKMRDTVFRRFLHHIVLSYYI